MKPSTKDLAILEQLLPHMMRALVEKGVVTERSLKNPGRLSSLFLRHIKTATEDFSILIALHGNFAADAYELWGRGKRLPAIVLFATAIEQLLNSHFRLSFLAQRFTNEEITQIIRSQTLDAKLTWLLKVSDRQRLPPALAKRLRIVFEVRNSIVHYKAVPGHPDRGDDSLDAIERRIKDLGRISFRRDIESLERILNSALLVSAPMFQLAHDAAQVVAQHWRNKRENRA
jgi:hypothetical protein